MLQEVYHTPPTKIDLIPHGIPDVGFVDPTFFKDQFGVEGRVVLLTFGLLSPNKGIEYVLNALPHILEEFPDVVYIVLGATHPNELREHGGAYRLTMDQAITIRTIVFRGDTYSFQAGAGIVADSVPAMEYQEVLAKSASVRGALALAQEGL
jgi:glycosyltransferase involved in cell wall biosynthesis